jgi:hypothetical protein
MSGYVQSVAMSATGNATSLAGTITPTSGNALIATINGRSGASATVSGPAGWTKAINNNQSNADVSIWYLLNYSGSGPQTYTWTMTASDGMVGEIIEANGVVASSALDQTAVNNSTTATNPIDSGTTATTSQANEFWVAALGSTGSGNRTASGMTAGWTQDLTENDGTATHPVHITTGYQVVTATGAADCQVTLSTAQVWIGCVATFKMTSGALSVSGALAGTGALAGEPVAVVGGALAGSGALAGEPVALVGGALSGAGQLAGTAVAPVAGGLAGSGALAGQPVALASGALAGVGALAGQPVALASGGLAGTGAVAGQPVALVGGAVAGSGALTGQPVAVVAGGLAGGGALSGTAVVIGIVTVSGALAGGGALAGASVAVVAGSLQGAGALSGTAVQVVIITTPVTARMRNGVVTARQRNGKQIATQRRGAVTVKAR